MTFHPVGLMDYSGLMDFNGFFHICIYIYDFPYIDIPICEPWCWYIYVHNWAINMG